MFKGAPLNNVANSPKPHKTLCGTNVRCLSPIKKYYINIKTDIIYSRFINTIVFLSM